MFVYLSIGIIRKLDIVARFYIYVCVCVGGVNTGPVLLKDGLGIDHESRFFVFFFSIGDGRVFVHSQMLHVMQL